MNPTTPNNRSTGGLRAKRVPKIAVSGPQRVKLFDAISTADKTVRFAYGVGPHSREEGMLGSFARRVWIEVEALLKQDRRPKSPPRKAKRR